MLGFLRKATCQHVWTWSERRQAERCHRCRATRQATAPEVFAPVFAATPEFQPEPEPRPSEFFVFNPGTDEVVGDFHTDRLHNRLVSERPAGASTTLLSSDP